jgi:hypothetical protein
MQSTVSSIAYAQYSFTVQLLRICIAFDTLTAVIILLIGLFGFTCDTAPLIADIVCWRRSSGGCLPSADRHRIG